MAGRTQVHLERTSAGRVEPMPSFRWPPHARSFGVRASGLGVAR